METTIDWITKKLSKGKQNRSPSGLTFYESAIGCMSVAIENAYMAGLEDQAAVLEQTENSIWGHSNHSIIKALIEDRFNDEGIKAAFLSFGTQVSQGQIDKILADKKIAPAELTQPQIDTLYFRAQLYMRYVLRAEHKQK